MLRLKKYLKPFRLSLFVTLILLFVQAMCDLALPQYMAHIVNNGITNGDTNYIIQVGTVMLAVALLGAICTIIVSFFGAQISAGFAKNLRGDLFEKVETLSNYEFDKFSTSSLITRTTNDITQIQMLVFMMIRMFLYAPIIGVGGIIKALSADVSMSWIIALAVILLLGLITTVFLIAVPKFKVIQKLIDRLNLVMRENLAGMLVIRAFSTERFEEKRFDQANLDLTKTNLFINRVAVLVMPAMMLIMNLVTILIVWIGAKQIAALEMQVGDMMAFMQYAMQIIMAFIMLSFMFIMLPRASVSAERIADVLEVIPSIQDPEKPRSFSSHFAGKVTFDHVSFRYPGAQEDILHNISFTAKPGQTTAFIGATGSGKTTLINLIPRFYDATHGEITIDGIDIRTVSIHDLRDKIGYVPQKGILFSGTIESNLYYGDQYATEEDLKLAAKIAQADAFIDERPEGLKAEIAQGGTNVSGGQRQRLSIARALVKKAPIYILDDSFCALDFKTDSDLRSALKAEMSGSTILLVAQRISTIMQAEQIIVLDEGRIAGIGTHKELMEGCVIYKEIALSQLSKEELSA